MSLVSQDLIHTLELIEMRDRIYCAMNALVATDSPPLQHLKKRLICNADAIKEELIYLSGYTEPTATPF